MKLRLQEEIGIDPTLRAADEALEKWSNAQPPRGYLGMSGIGDCRRKNYLRWTLAFPEKFEAKTLKNFADGHRTEDLCIERLRMAEGMTIVDREDGRQIEVSDCSGHFLGHLDGEILGLRQAPTTWHVLEIKCVNERSFKKFQKYKFDLGEKFALKEWNHTYYVQHQLYMHYRNRKRGYLVVMTAGGRDWDAVRTEYNKADAELYISKAKEMVDNIRILPAAEGSNVKAPPCLFCSFQKYCFEGAAPERNCRTCIYAEPIEDGNWFCGRHDKYLSYREQLEGCKDQRYRPEYIKSGSISDIGDDFIVYDLNDGTQWTDEGPDDAVRGVSEG